jgi:hypothetical protein
VHHRTIQINHQPDATIFQFIILKFVYGSTCFGRFPAHHQELNDCCGSLWFYLRIVVTVVLCSCSGRPAGFRRSYCFRLEKMEERFWQQYPPKRMNLLIRLRGVTSNKALFFIMHTALFCIPFERLNLLIQLGAGKRTRKLLSTLLNPSEMGKRTLVNQHKRWKEGYVNAFVYLCGCILCVFRLGDMRKATILFVMSVRLQVSDRLLTGRIFVKFCIG